MLDFLKELEANNDDSARTLYLPPGLPPPEIEKALHIISPPLVPEIADIAVSSKRGIALFHGDPQKCLIVPPFPIEEKTLLPSYVAEPLYRILEKDWKIALVLVRLGAYAIGLCQGETIIDAKVGTGLVHGRHRQGGSSSSRFRRHREKQIEQFLVRVCTHVQEKFESQTIDYLIYGGAWTTILSLQKQCPFLQKFDDRVLPPLLDIPKPNRETLETAVKRVWSSKVIEFDEIPQQ
jgi:peptide subunit release factor 1 (eRF1)